MHNGLSIDFCNDSVNQYIRTYSAYKHTYIFRFVLKESLVKTQYKTFALQIIYTYIN